MRRIPHGYICAKSCTFHTHVCHCPDLRFSKVGKYDDDCTCPSHCMCVAYAESQCVSQPAVFLPVSPRSGRCRRSGAALPCPLPPARATARAALSAVCAATPPPTRVGRRSRRRPARTCSASPAHGRSCRSMSACTWVWTESWHSCCRYCHCWAGALLWDLSFPASFLYRSAPTTIIVVPGGGHTVVLVTFSTAAYWHHAPWADRNKYSPLVFFCFSGS